MLKSKMKLETRNKYPKRTLSKLDHLRQSKQRILKLISHEHNQVASNIFKSQIIYLDSEILKAEIKENRCNTCKTIKCDYCKHK